MGINGFYRPESLENGKEYLLRLGRHPGEKEYKIVLFLGYRPHPGEVVVRDGDLAKMVYRVDLFEKEGC